MIGNWAYNEDFAKPCQIVRTLLKKKEIPDIYHVLLKTKVVFTFFQYFLHREYVFRMCV